VRPYPPEAHEDVAELRALGWGARRISAHLGIPSTTVFRWLNPDYESRGRERSRRRKQKIVGVCVDCGGETRYAGKNGRQSSLRCAACAARHQRKNRVWTQEAITEAVRWAYGELGRPLRTVDFHTERVDGLPSWATLRDRGLFPRTACALAGVPFHSGWKGLGARGGDASHGTTYRYHLGCRCEKCRAAMSTYQRSWYAAKKAAAIQG
jgi:hypothetical protein